MTRVQVNTKKSRSSKNVTPGGVKQTRFCSVCRKPGHDFKRCPDNPKKVDRKASCTVAAWSDSDY